MMKRMAAALMALMMMAAIGARAEVELEAVTKHYVEGKVVEITEDGRSFLVDDVVMGHVIVNISDETRMAVDGGLSVGRYVLVEYNGAMTFSIPGQITATSVMGYVLEGEVLSIENDGKAIMVSNSLYGEVLVTLPEGSLTIPAPGSYVFVSYNGIMAMSYPGQIGAWYVEAFTRFAGEVTQADDSGILIEAEDGTQILALVNEGTVLADEVKAGDKAELLYNGILTRSLPPQGNAIYLRILAAE